MGTTVERDRLQHVAEDAPIEFKGIQAHERRGERRLERLDAGEQP